MKLKRLLLYIATTLSIILAVFFGQVAYTSLQETNPSPSGFNTFYCCGSSCLNMNGKCTTVSWPDLLLFIVFTAISFSLLVLGVYILFSKIKLLKLKKLLFYIATILSFVLAVLFGVASITNLQRVPPNFLSSSCQGSLDLNTSGVCSPQSTISWLALILFISFTAISFSLLALGIYILIKRKKVVLD